MPTLNQISEHYHAVRALRGDEAAEQYLDAVAAIARISEKPSAKLVDSAIRMANTEVARVAFASGGSCQVRNYNQPIE
jgi:hypothetical protein